MRLPRPPARPLLPALCFCLPGKREVTTEGSRDALSNCEVLRLIKSMEFLKTDKKETDSRKDEEEHERGAACSHGDRVQEIH